MVDSNCNHFVLLSRLQQAEALIEKRKQDLENHQKRCLQLELTYVQDKELTSYAAQELAGVREQLNADNRQAIQLKRDIATAQQELVATLDTARLLSVKHNLQQQLSSLQSMVGKELKVQQDYEATVAQHMDRVRTVQHHTDRAEQIRAKMQQLEQQEAKMGLSDITHKLQQQHNMLLDELQQLNAALNDKKQANANLQTRIEACRKDTQARLQAAKDELADLKRESFQINRQAAINATRLKQLRQESISNKQQCCELNGLISQALAVMDQLASNCDM